MKNYEEDALMLSFDASAFMIAVLLVLCLVGVGLKLVEIYFLMQIVGVRQGGNCCFS